MTRAVLSIGSNIGDRLSYLRSAVAAFEPWIVARSSVYETSAWGPVEQQTFLNAVVIVDDIEAAPEDWLARAQACEQAADRTREVRWGPRTLDVDVIAVDDLRSDNPVLILPHPRAAERAFVLIPWLEVDPSAELLEGPISALLDAIDPIEILGVSRVIGIDLVRSA